MASLSTVLTPSDVTAEIGVIGGSGLYDFLDEFDTVEVTTGAPAAKAQVQFSLGESVKVTSGPLSDFDGEIVDVNPDQQKLKVLVDIFERQVPVELGFDQVKKID